MYVRLTRKLAEQIDGIDLSNHAVGDVIDLPGRKARTLVAEGWAVFERRSRALGGHLVLAFRRGNDPGQLSNDRVTDVSVQRSRRRA
jgi:hypothetical protein